MRTTLLATCTILFGLLGLVASARADRPGRWDSRGWVKLGEREVSARVDRDTITVGRAEGTFSKLTLVIEDSSLELLDLKVKFANGEVFDPRVQHVFREGARSRVIDLPGDDRVIRTIDLVYKNLPGGGRAKVEVWGWKTDAASAGKPGPGPRPGPRPGPPAEAWDPRGWRKLGERTVNARVDRDRITVGRYQGRFSKLTLVVLDSDLELLDFDVKFARGPAWNPAVTHVFREGQRTRVLDLPGDDRVIRYVDLKYRNVPGGGRAKVQVWAR